MLEREKLYPLPVYYSNSLRKLIWCDRLPVFQLAYDCKIFFYNIKVII